MQSEGGGPVSLVLPRDITTAAFPIPCKGAHVFIFTEPSGHQNVTGALSTETRLIYETVEDQKTTV